MGYGVGGNLSTIAVVPARRVDCVQNDVVDWMSVVRENMLA